MCKFSIIVPAYNVESYIDRCLKAIKSQEYKDYEVIIVNDGSTDNSVKIIEKYLSDKRFKLINQDNKGLSAARNSGIKKAIGDYLIFIDSDDYISDDLLIKLDKILIKKYDLVKIQYNYLYNEKIEEVIDNIILNKEYSNEDYFMEILNLWKKLTTKILDLFL